MPVFPEGITDAERRSIMFEALSALDLSLLVEKRENLTYLSWANCFSVLKQIYPLATYRVIKNPANGLPYFTDSNVGIFVYTEVEIEGITTECFLPVMDNKNKAMKLNLIPIKFGITIRNPTLIKPLMQLQVSILIVPFGEHW